MYSNKLNNMNKIETIVLNHKKTHLIKFNIIQDGNKVTYDTVQIVGELTYDNIVNAIISYKYPIDKMQAIVNNYLLDNEDQTAVDEFKQMQDWRKFAKSYAKELI